MTIKMNFPKTRYKDAAINMVVVAQVIIMVVVRERDSSSALIAWMGVMYALTFT